MKYDNNNDAVVERAWRDNQLEAVVDKLQLPLRFEDLTESEKTALRNYRSALLDYPNHTDFPNNHRPTL